jgi:hypothetical protein
MIVEINSIDQTDLVVAGSLSVSTSITSQVSEAFFQIRKYGGRTFTPDVDDIVEIYDGADKIFKGIVMDIAESLDAPTALMYNINCVSSSWKLDRLLAARAYQNKSVGQILTELVAEFAPDFTVDAPTATFNVRQIVFNNIPVSDAIFRLSKILSYEWYVDVNDVIHFQPRLSEPAPYNLTDTSGNYAYRGLVRKLDGTQIVNKVIVRGGEYDGELQTDDITVTGSVTSAFNLPSKFANLTVELDSGSGFVAQTVGIDPIDNFDSFDVLYNYQGQSIRWENPLDDGYVIRYSGNPKFRAFAVQGSAISEARYGKREKVIRDNSIEDNDTARRRAIAELQTYANEIQDANFFTYTPGLRAGMRINLTSTERDCNVDFVIKKLTFQAIDPTNFGYKVDCITTQKYDLIDLLRYILEPETPETDETAEIIEFVGEALEIAEVITRVMPEANIEALEINENIQNDPLGAGVEPTWVWGYYFPLSITDPNRMLYWGTGGSNWE